MKRARRSGHARLCRALPALCCVLWAVTCSLPSRGLYAQTTGQRPSTLGPGLTSNPTVYNPGTQLPLPDQPISPQVFYQAVTTSCAVNSTCGTTNDSGKILTATGPGVVFTLPAATAPGTSGYTFGYDGSNSYSVGSSSNIFGACGGNTPSAAGLTSAVALVPAGTKWLCVAFGGAAAAAPPSGIAFVQGAGGSTASAAGVTTASTTLNGTVAGNFLVALTSAYYASTTPAALTVTATGTTCYHAGTTFNNPSTPNLLTDISFCPNSAGGNITLTVTATTNTMDYCELLAAEFSGVTATSAADIGKGAKFSGTTTAPSVVSGTTTQNNQLVVSVLSPATSNPTNATGTNQIVFPSSAGNRLASYGIVNTSGSAVTHSWTIANQAVAASIAVFSHP